MDQTQLKMATPTSSLLIQDLFSVKDKTVLITGGGAGVGYMMSQGFITNGANIIIASRNEKQLQTAAEQLNALNKGRCTAIKADLSSLSNITQFVESLQNQYGIKKIDVLINNSGVAWGEPLEQFSEKGWDNVMNVNVKSLFFLTKALLPLLKASGSSSSDPSRIINIGSVAGIRPQSQPTYSYDLSKAAVHHLTHKLSNDLAKYNITVNSIAPGYFPSKMSNQLRLQREQLQKLIPLGRVGTVEDIAGVAIFLSSRAGSFLSGALVTVDGGQIAIIPPISKL